MHRGAAAVLFIAGDGRCAAAGYPVVKSALEIAVLECAVFLRNGRALGQGQIVEIADASVFVVIEIDAHARRRVCHREGERALCPVRIARNGSNIEILVEHDLPRRVKLIDLHIYLCAADNLLIIGKRIALSRRQSRHRLGHILRRRGRRAIQHQRCVAAAMDFA